MFVAGVLPEQPGQTDVATSDTSRAVISDRRRQDTMPKDSNARSRTSFSVSHCPLVTATARSVTNRPSSWRVSPQPSFTALFPSSARSSGHDKSS